MTSWTATGTQFQVPYVFKTLFAKKPIVFADMCETKSVTSGSIYLDMCEGLPDVSEEEALAKYIQSSDYAKVGTLDKNGKEIKHPLKYRDVDFNHLDMEKLNEDIARGHNYIFIGRVGLFCPIKEGKGGGVLYREKDGQYFSVTGTKGYKWLEAEQVKALKLETYIDNSYYLKLCSDAIDDISQYGNFEWFSSDMEYDQNNNGIFPF